MFNTRRLPPPVWIRTSEPGNHLPLALPCQSTPALFWYQRMFWKENKPWTTKLAENYVGNPRPERTYFAWVYRQWKLTHSWWTLRFVPKRKRHDRAGSYWEHATRMWMPTPFSDLSTIDWKRKNIEICSINFHLK